MRSVLFRFLVVLLIIGAAVPLACANEYIVRSGYDSPVPDGADARVPEAVPFTALPFWVMLAEMALFPAELFLGLKLWAYLGIRRVSGINVLDQDLRARIYEYIRENPGIHLRGLSSEMQVKMGTLRYHLGVLSRNHKIAVNGDTSSVRFYENNGTYNAGEQQIHKHLRNETTQKILMVLLECPEASRQELADAAGVTGPSVSWHMKRLEKDRIVIPHRRGRVTCYVIPDHVAGYLARQVQPSSTYARDCPGVAGHA